MALKLLILSGRQVINFLPAQLPEEVAIVKNSKKDCSIFHI